MRDQIQPTNTPSPVFIQNVPIMGILAINLPAQCVDISPTTINNL